MATSSDPARELVQGDALDLLRQRDDNSAEAATLDFPWEFDASNGTGRMKQDGGDDYVKELPYDVTDHHYLSVALYELARTVKDGGWVFVFADDDVLPEFRRRVENCQPLTYRRTLAWDQEQIGMGYYHRVQHYPIIAATVGDTDRYVQGRGTVFREKTIRHGGSGPDWPTAKPPALYESLVAPPVLEPGETLLEPFAGTAPGLAAAKANDAGYWGCDVAEDPLEIARDREAQTTLPTGGHE